MNERPLRTTVVGSYPFPGWLEHATAHLDDFGPDDRAELVDDAVLCAIHDQVKAGLDVITDGEQTRLDFSLSFYGHLEGIKSERERFFLGDGVFYLHAPDGIGRSKLAANVERLLGVRATARNWRTVGKVMEMANERG